VVSVITALKECDANAIVGGVGGENSKMGIAFHEYSDEHNGMELAALEQTSSF